MSEQEANRVVDRIGEVFKEVSFEQSFIIAEHLKSGYVWAIRDGDTVYAMIPQQYLEHLPWE